MSNEKYPELFGDLVYSYTRADALRDGVLVALPHAQAVGFRVPVAITDTAYAACIAWPETDPKLSNILRLREEMVLLAAVMEAKAHRRREQSGVAQRADRIDFTVETVQLREGKADLIRVEMYMVVGPGDDHGPVGTIMLIGED